MGHKRALFRVTIDRSGQIQRVADTLPCKVVDLTEKGFLLQSEGVFQVGEDLHLEFALNDTGLLRCSVRVTHVRAPYLGAAIVRISPDDQAQIAGFIEQLNALNMTGF